jgi:hypothetical protein
MKYAIIVDQEAEQRFELDDADPAYPGKFTIDWVDTIDSHSLHGGMVFTREELVKLAEFIIKEYA